jgi:hypothetical protein
VEDFTDEYTGLFSVLTDHPDDFNRWVAHTFPVEIDISAYSPKVDKDIKYQTIGKFILAVLLPTAIAILFQISLIKKFNTLKTTWLS